MRLRRWTVSAVIAAIAAGAAATAGAQAPGLVGKWSADQRCAPQAPQIVFRGTTMELWDRAQRVFSGTVRFQPEGNQVAVLVQGVNTPAQPGNPEVGDIATFRRDGNRLFGVAVTRRGERRAAPEGTPPFHLCR